jgi:hypothetical protein
MKSNNLPSLQRDGEAVQRNSGQYAPKQKLSELSIADLIAMHNSHTSIEAINSHVMKIYGEIRKRADNIDWDN